ncbi:ester cyclase (plasmid) [Streptomyces sp. NBC_00053]|uniref:ester cyclase n=1 Tax=unclassified Streptomyces TaxID=2593676 RepID=UPI00225BA66A|nr:MULTISPECIES: ester cyclase [unclassified Streptomyces]MCX4399495.1 ester cyclase [Streptomyces sp. NBC_01767]MCX5106802.1 ester cyclase [Streptomyces sp. NBC_00439]MCX5506162.1 ester cyclase [Streptomyces sp. NBC_00052]MCX5554135.1 ester cyclase [Streptomyces sp. NBC_00051]
MDTKTLARRFLEETADEDRESVYALHCTADYTEHDPNMEQETVGLDQAVRYYREAREAFEVTHTAQSLVAEGDLACMRFLIHGRHTGPYQGHPPSGRAFETTGHVSLRLDRGKIAESWFNYDLAGALRQVGAPPGTSL